MSGVVTDEALRGPSALVDDRLYNVQQAAVAVGLGVAQVRYLERVGELRRARVRGFRVYFLGAEVKRFVREAGAVEESEGAPEGVTAPAGAVAKTV